MSNNHSHEAPLEDDGTRKRDRILVVDDEDDTRELFAGGLGQSGYECVKAGDA